MSRSCAKNHLRSNNPLPGDPSEWIDKGNYWLSIHPQTSPPWHAIKEKAYLVTASRFGPASGIATRYKSQESLGNNISGLRPPSPIPKRNQEKMQRGVIKEPIARNWYCHTRQVQVDEVGLAIPKWYPRIGCSLDGEVIGQHGEKEGMIEIKCPDVMPWKIAFHQKRLDEGWVPPPFYHDHISPDYYCQMQGCMAICEKKWCDFIVFITDTQQAYVERVPFNQRFWEEELFPGLCKFITTILDPKIALAKELKETTGSSIAPPGMLPEPLPEAPAGRQPEKETEIPALAITIPVLNISENGGICVVSPPPEPVATTPVSPESAKSQPSTNPDDTSTDEKSSATAKAVSSSWLQRRLAQSKKT
jgi:hypothetical protein